MKRASAEHSLLLVLHGRMDVSGEAIAVMRQTLDYDPMFGGVVARTRCSTGCCVRRPSRGLTPGAWVPRRTLADTPELEICPEVFESALLLSPTAVAEFGPLDEALFHSARRDRSLPVAREALRVSDGTGESRGSHRPL